MTGVGGILKGKVGFISLGCSKNLVNTEQMMHLVKSAGYEITGETENINVAIINTCGFIGDAKDEALDTINELIESKRAGSISKIVVTGCLAERYKEDILKMLPDVDAVVGTGSFDNIAEVLEFKKNKFFEDINAPISETNRIITTSNIWAYLKIADGCDNRCAFCMIPKLRGNYRSRPAPNITSEARKLVSKGTRELTLVAQDLTRYGTDIYGKRKLKDLLISLNDIEKLEWIRLLYLYPDTFDDEIIDLIAKSDKIVKYVDIPIQHISDVVLKKMRRRGTGNDIRSLFKHIRERIDNVVIRTSIIAGLPGESEKEFEELCEFLTDMKIERLGVFPYSPEEGTDAYSMERPTKEVALQRAEEVENIQSQIMYDFNNKRIGTVTRVLTEAFYPYARSYAEAPEVDGYIIVEGEEVEQNTFLDVKIKGVSDGELIGEPI